MLRHPLSAYQPALSPAELGRVLAELCAKARQTEWLLCRYLADIADDDRYRDLGWYADVYQYAREQLGLGAKITRERVRMGRALRELPKIQEAFVAGTLSYSRVRELTRVATAGDEAEWLVVAKKVSMRELERRVAKQVGASEVCERPAEVAWRTPETVDVTLRMPADAWALLQRAMSGARHAADQSLSDAASLEAVAQEALSSLAQADATEIADPRKAVVLYQCTECRSTELETGAGAMPLSSAAAERLGEGARTIDLAIEGKEEACVGGAMPAAVRRAVLARDRGRCRFCGRWRYVDVHHLQPLSEGGEHSWANCVCACTGCHAAIHAGELRVEGNADGALRWYARSGKLLGSEEPGAQPARRWRSEQTAKVHAAMKGRGGFHADGLCQATGLSAAAVARALFELTGAGEIVEERLGIYASRLAAGRLGTEPGPTTDPAHSAAPRARRPKPCPNVGHEVAVQATSSGPACNPAPPPPSRPKPCPKVGHTERSQSTLRGDSAVLAPPEPSRPKACPNVGHGERTPSTRPALALGPPEVGDALLEALRSSGTRPAGSDELCQATGHDVSQVTVALLELELAGRVRAVTPGTYALAPAVLAS